MIEDKYNILNILKQNNGNINLDSLAQIISEDLQKEILTDKDKLLLNLIFSENPSQEALNECLREYDIEVEGGHKALMLAYFMKMHPDLKYSDYVAPRLKGLLKYYRFQNVKLISHYAKICRELEKNKISFMILKGGCMKHLRPEYPRVMSDIDILVEEKNWKRCGQIADNMGYDLCWDTHSIDLHTKGNLDGIIDIHRYILMESAGEKNITNDIFKRATTQKVFGIDTLVPCNEDLFFILLVNMIRNLMHKSSYSGILYNLFDCIFLIGSKPDFNWNIVIQNAKKTKTENQIYFAIKFLNNIVPDLLPEHIKKDMFFENQFKNYCILLIYQRFFLWNMKQKSHKMKIKDLFSSKKFFKEYCALKPKYFILKRSIIRKNPYLAEIILKKANIYEN